MPASHLSLVEKLREMVAKLSGSISLTVKLGDHNMKEVKAYIRCQKAEGVIEALEEMGVKGITLIDVMGVGRLADPHSSKYSIKCVEKYSEVGKLELVCSDQDVHKVVETIREKAYTGLKGDGIIYVAPVEMAVKIRTGAVGEEAV